MGGLNRRGQRPSCDRALAPGRGRRLLIMPLSRMKLTRIGPDPFGPPLVRRGWGLCRHTLLPCRFSPGVRPRLGGAASSTSRLSPFSSGDRDRAPRLIRSHTLSRTGSGCGCSILQGVLPLRLRAPQGSQGWLSVTHPAGFPRRVGEGARSAARMRAGPAAVRVLQAHCTRCALGLGAPSAARVSSTSPPGHKRPG